MYSTDSLPPANLDATLGAAFVGLSVTLFIYSLNVGQLVLYLRTSHQDTWCFKSLILFLWLLDSAHVTFITMGIWQYTITSRGDLFAILRFVWAFGAQVFAMLVGNLIVRYIFAYRIWKLGGRRTVAPLLIGISSTWSAVMTTIITIRTVSSASWGKSKIIEFLMFSGSAAEIFGDSVIAIVMTRLLKRFRTGLASSDSIVQTFIVYSVNTGALTVLCISLSLITAFALPHSFVSLALYLIVGKLYLNSLLGTLNARSRLIAHPEESIPLLTTDIEIQFSDERDTMNEDCRQVDSP
ncbi:hypothetical protein OBBRIDRAFT_456773 [Obba rivulosa]|uniref:DUF6534 domain-containing protein n=1 Tax=Obba rivulosa TaxID=1052685 RepID=A0A8E2AWT3_9APHY|nr:hypothetical protein OBBRIDRAFT_456773 [Obba rivulosa]